MLEARVPWSTAAPVARSRLENWPTLLFSWWCTSFAAVIIITRLVGRKTRSNRLFREDWIMMYSMIPLFIRMILIHFVLIYGTNNVDTVGHTFTAEELYHRSIGARLVLGARIFYAMFIWMSKFTISEFLKRITIRIWRRRYEWTLFGIRGFLFATFGAVVIATLAECQPFDHYWQVVPDPGPQCRNGYAQLLTMGVSDIITDLLLIGFPIPVVLSSGQTWKRKLQMGSLFSLSIIMIAVTATRMPAVIMHLGRQQYRTVWASCEILASAAVSNAVILGSFLRDKGTKKNKFRTHSATESMDRPSTRRPTLVTLDQTGSDEDLFRSVGFAIPEHLQDKPDGVARPAPPALSAAQSALAARQVPIALPPSRLKGHEERSSDSDDSLRNPPFEALSSPSPAPSTNKSVSFFDVGHLLEDGNVSPGSRSRATTIADSSIVSHDFAPPSPGGRSRRGSRVHFQDVGGAWTPASSRDGRPYAPFGAAPRRPSDGGLNFNRARGSLLGTSPTQVSLQDAGGLLRTPLDSPIEENDVPLRDLPPRSPLSFEDVGGLLSSHTREPDASAGALQRVWDSRDSPRRGSPDDPPLHDPGEARGGAWPRR